MSSLGCIAVWSGHSVPVGIWHAFIVDKTTIADVRLALGEPENIVQKSPENLTTYVYQSVGTLQLGIGGIPFPVFVGRSRQRGFTLNVIFRDGVFKGYELIQLEQRLFFK